MRANTTCARAVGEVSVILTRRLAVQIFVCASALCGVAGSASAQLPSPWANRDIGSPSTTGSAAESSGTFTVRGGGTDIWSTSDQFHFVSQPVTGDVDIRAQVTAVQYIHQWTKAGVMIRETLGATSRQASTFVSPGKGLAFQRRVSTGGNSAHTPGGSATAPYWVRMVRVGQLFTSYVSADGVSWQLVDTETIAMGASVEVGLAVTSHDASRSAMATFTNVSVNGPVSTPPPPSAWSSGDIGSPALAGRSSEANGTFSVTGAGSDIWGARDQFQFMYQQASGDLDIVARVNTIGYAHQWSKAGVMIRESLSDSAAHAFMTGSAGKGWAFQRRPVSGGNSVNSPGSLSTPPGWVRLVRQGDLFTAFESTNGTDWEVVGTETIQMPTSVYVGLAVTSHNQNATSTATFTNVAVTKPPPSPNTPNEPPSITLVAPANGTTYVPPAAVTFSASASDSDGTIVTVSFYANGEIVATDTTSPFTLTWSPVPEGTYNLTAVATDDEGATATSATVTITVRNSTNQPPTVSITSPANGATFTAPATITLNATAADTDGTVASVEFFANGQSIGTDASSPYSFTWSNVTAGTYSVTAVARDNANATRTSAAVTVTVTGLPAPWTSGDIGSPALAGSSSVANGTFTVTGAGIDVWDTSDQFQFVYQPLQGDVEIIARVQTLEGPNPWSKAGVMIRETLGPSAPNVYVAATIANGWTFQRRRVAGDISYGIPTRPAGTAPGWVRLARTGNDFRGYYSPDGTTWTLLGSDTISMGATVYVGLAVTSHDATARATGTLSSVTVGSPTPLPNQPPTVALTSPANGATFAAPATIPIAASASDSNGSVTRVDFLRGSTVIGSDTTSPYSMTWSNVAAGTYSLTAVAYDNGGASTASAAVSITVTAAPTTQPTTLLFTPSADHATSVTSYSVAIYRGTDPTTATPAATKNLGKPSPVNNEISLDISDIVNPLAAGSYYAVVTAIASTGSAPSAPSAAFTK